ncbi:MAG: ribonuclease T [Alphaproteobacteria bacterium]|jgi:ribonuclease T2
MRTCRFGLWHALAGLTFVFAALYGPEAARAEDQDLVLAVSWQPGFCETKPNLPECRTQTASRFDATHFTLHGLWPQPRGNDYCGVTPEIVALDRPESWKLLPAMSLPDSLREELAEAMPGTQSGLDRHEWIKHGTCYHPRDPESYFAHSLTLLKELNRSPVRHLFQGAIGNTLTAGDIRDAFNEAFGPGAGERVEIVCRELGPATLIVELRIALAGQPGEESLSSLIAAAPPRADGCDGGLVDAAGFDR